MGTEIGISPSVMINRIVHEAAVPQDAQMAEVAKLRGKLALAEDKAEGEGKPIPAPANGAEVDLLI